MAQMNKTKSQILSIAVVSVLALLSGCGKSDQQSAEQQAIEKHEQKALQQKAADLEFQKQLKVPGMGSTLEAGRFLVQLLESGHLPGAENAEKGAMLSPDSIYTPQSTNYPMSRTFNGQRKLGGPWENHYTVAKTSADSPWQLQKAWRTDAQGNTVEEYPPK